VAGTGGLEVTSKVMPCENRVGRLGEKREWLNIIQRLWCSGGGGGG